MATQKTSQKTSQKAPRRKRHLITSFNPTNLITSFNHLDKNKTTTQPSEDELASRAALHARSLAVESALEAGILKWDDYDEHGRLIKYPSYCAKYEYDSKTKEYTLGFPDFGWGAITTKNEDELKERARELLRILILSTISDNEPLPKPKRSRVRGRLTRDHFMVSPQKSRLPLFQTPPKMSGIARHFPGQLPEFEEDGKKPTAEEAHAAQAAAEGKNPHAGSSLHSFLSEDGSFDEIVDEFKLVQEPDHYRWHPTGVECNEIAQHFSANIGRAIAYLWRAEHKRSAVNDYHKAIQYIRWEISRIEGAGRTMDGREKMPVPPGKWESVRQAAKEEASKLDEPVVEAQS